jgi:hypothetical protein
MTATARKSLAFHHRLPHVPLKPLRMSTVAPRPTPRAPDQKLVERVRREFSDMRGLSPTMAQAQRLFHLGSDECYEIFAQLLQEGFLNLCADDRYRLRPAGR